MSKFLLRIEAIDARFASYSCPRGTAGRIHTLRLRKRFQADRRAPERSVGTLQGVYPPSYAPVFQKDDQDEVLGRQQPSEAISSSQSTVQDSLDLNKTLGNEFFTHVREPSIAQRPTSIEHDLVTGRDHKLPTHLARARFGDMAGKMTLDADIISEYDVHDNVRNASEDKLRQRIKVGKENLYTALKSGSPFEILDAALELDSAADASLDKSGGIAKLPQSTFSEILRCLEPSALVGRYLDLHKEISLRGSTSLDALAEDAGGRYRFCVLFMKRIHGIVVQRNAAGLKLSISDYKYLLRCARTVGNSSLSHKMWVSMKNDRIKPDTDCYNHYLAAQVWSDMLLPQQRNNVRVVPHNLEMRQQQLRFRGYLGHRVGPGGIKQRITQTFNQMARDGIAGNEETFCLMIIGFAREGDLDGISSILQKVWGIDVARLIQGDDKTDLPAKSIRNGSPLRPSQRLLLSLAHTYGINNAIPTALKLVDYVSRQYEVPITVEVWEELIERTYVLTKQRKRKQRDRGDATGQLPADAVGNLWAALVAEPYNVQPTMPMYDKAILSLLRRQRFPEALEFMEMAYSSQAKIWPSLKSVLAMKASLSSDGRQRDRVDRDAVFLGLRLYRNHRYYSRWCHQLYRLASKSVGHHPSFSLKMVPNLIERWSRYFPNELDYNTPTGSVSIVIGRQYTKDVELVDGSLTGDDQKEDDRGDDQGIFDDDIL